MRENRRVRQELLFAVQDNRDAGEFVKLLFHVAENLIRTGHALLRGDIIPLCSSIAPGSAADTLYASIPVVFPEGLATLNDSMPATVFVWLIPLQSPEVAFVKSSGWSEFEDRLEIADPNLFNLYRSSIV
jgi:hypothetical protein